MFSKENFIESIGLETEICKHLYSKLDHGTLDYRPTEGQRSMLELLQYLTGTLEVPTKCLLENDWSAAGEYLEKTKRVTVDGFCDAMDQQFSAVKNLMAPLTESDFTRQTSFPTGQEVILGPALINFTIKFSAAYRMQFFLYLKANGKKELNTFNCWFGIDGAMP